MGTSDEDIRDILDLDPEDSSGSETDASDTDASNADASEEDSSSASGDNVDDDVSPPEEVFSEAKETDSAGGDGATDEGAELLEEFTEPQQEEEDTDTGESETGDRPTVQMSQSRSKELVSKAQKASPDASEDEILRASNILDQIEVMEQTRSAIGFDQSDLVSELIEEEMWELYGYSSFSALFQSNELENISRSAAYRYKRVGEFMDEFPIGEKDFDDKFYEETGLDKVEVTDEDGNVLEEETRQKNSLRNKLNFTDVEKVAGIYDQGKIDSAQALELMKKSLSMLSEDFKEEIQKHKDEKENTITEELNDRAINGPAVMANAQNPEKAAENLGRIKTKLEQGSDLARKVIDNEGSQGIEKIGSKKVTFYELDDGTVMIDF